MPHTSSPPRFLYHEIINEKLLLRRDHISQMTRPCDGNMDSVDWHKRWGRGASVHCSAIQYRVKWIFIIWIQIYWVYVYVWGVGWRGLKSIANIIPLSMSLAPCLFNHPRQICLKYSNLPKTVSHQTAKWPYFSCYSSIMILTFSNKKWELRDYP